MSTSRPFETPRGILPRPCTYTASFPRPGLARHMEVLGLRHGKVTRQPLYLELATGNPCDKTRQAPSNAGISCSSAYTVRPPNDDIPPEVLQEADPPANARQVALLLHIVTLQPPIDDTPDDFHKMNDQQWCQDIPQCRILDRRHGEINIVNLSQTIGASLFSVEAPHQYGRPVNLFAYNKCHASLKWHTHWSITVSPWSDTNPPPDPFPNRNHLFLKYQHFPIHRPH